MRTEPKVVYKPVIRDFGYVHKVYYHNTKGQNVQYQAEGKCVALPKALSQIVSGEKPNVDKEELLLKFWELYGKVISPGVVINRAEKLIDFFALPKSEGGEKITPNEQYKMMEIWHQWFGKQ